tara:strand:+ start:385 stop:2112 length:1728 start_codon:yes stop_codon:yes gene_type:complete
MIFFLKIIPLFIKFFIEELKIFRARMVNFFVFFQEVYFIKFLIHKITFSQNLNIFKINDLNNFINYNNKTINKKFKKDPLNKKIFVESFINHPVYTIQNCIIAYTTSRILKTECCGIIRRGDIKSKKIFDSFGIKKVIYIDQGNILSRIYNLVIAFKLLNKIKSIDALLKLKIEKIEFGKTIYEQYLRFKKNPEIKNIVFDFYFFLSQALILNNQFKKIFINNNTYLIQAETQYFPFSLSKQNALKYKNKIISKGGELSNISLKIFKNLKDSRESRNRPSKELFELVYKKLKKQKLKKLLNNSSRFFNLNVGKEIHQLIKKEEKLILFKSKKDVNKHFGWNNNKPIVLILAHEFTEGNLSHSWNLFHNNFYWLEETIKKIKKIKNVNWIIKPHPSENIHNSKIITFDIYNKLVNDELNIKLFPSSHDIQDFYKFISVVITSSGTAGHEYPIKSIPTIICGESNYSGFGFTLEPKSKKEYFYMLKKINKIKKLDKETIKRCFAYNYLNKYVALEKIPLLYDTNITMQFEKKIFWKKTYKLLRKNGVFYQSLYNSLKFQIENDNSYLVNLNKYKIKY